MNKKIIGITIIIIAILGIVLGFYIFVYNQPVKENLQPSFILKEQTTEGISEDISNGFDENKNPTSDPEEIIEEINNQFEEEENNFSLEEESSMDFINQSNLDDFSQFYDENEL